MFMSQAMSSILDVHNFKLNSSDAPDICFSDCGVLLLSYSSIELVRLSLITAKLIVGKNKPSRQHLQPVFKRDAMSSRQISGPFLRNSKKQFCKYHLAFQKTSL